MVLGGLSAEQEISEITGESVARVLSGRGYNVTVLRAGRDLPERLRAHRIDVVFNALHGRFGEDGCVQGMLEMMGIPYTGSGVRASAIGMSKSVAKRIWESEKLPTAPWKLVRSDEKVTRTFRLPSKLPVVVKPDGEGSSVGVTIVREVSKLAGAVERARAFDDEVVIERYIAGKEVTVGILNDEPLTAMEVIPKGEFHSWDVKYTEGQEEFVLPAKLEKKSFDRVIELAVAAYRMIRAESYARVDLRVSASGKPYLIEINTLPGLTSLSYLPKMAEHRGVAYPELVERILEGARVKLQEVRR